MIIRLATRPEYRPDSLGRLLDPMSGHTVSWRFLEDPDGPGATLECDDHASASDVDEILTWLGYQPSGHPEPF